MTGTGPCPAHLRGDQSTPIHTVVEGDLKLRNADALITRPLTALALIPEELCRIVGGHERMVGQRDKDSPIQHLQSDLLLIRPHRYAIAVDPVEFLRQIGEGASHPLYAFGLFVRIVMTPVLHQVCPYDDHC